jgi:glycerol-3-phosphate dehydrogenase
MAIADHVRDELGTAGMPLEPTAADPPEFRMPNIGELGERPYQRPDLIERDPEYGRVVCFCERVTGGEIRDALAGPLPAVDLDGLRRRTRAHMGRCQGFFCGAELVARLEGGRR